MCNSDRRHFLRLSMVALGAAGAVGIAGVALAAEADPAKAKVYVCPPCGCAADSKEFPAPGQCPECGMELIEKPPATPKLGAQDRDDSRWRARPQLAKTRPAARARPGVSAPQNT